ncbi:MAG TPA: valine--tRNA ligase [Verrucomicrobiales bacterium]|nr:valine--tRNA ligase [Verrucomicrobiales bacterium]
MPEISKAYEPQAVEDRWYQFWTEKKCFAADPASAKPPFSIVIPPPNVTGMLTLGHVLNNTIQDILARRARMQGFEVLWLPGTDHAGIATQTVVERTLKKQGLIKHRNDLGREKFLEKVWEWKEKHGGIIIQQLKKLGASCDWSRERFTMDRDYSRAVAGVFVDLYRKGLIYRGKRMVNWCPASQTALSDEEVEMKEQQGLLYYFKVEVAEEPGTFLTIATTRPETIPGDTAVAVNPKDPRYARLIGKHVLRPLPSEYAADRKRIPIVGDEHVDFEFGTGVLKVTPAHDRADFDIGQRHKLPVVEVINADGSMNDLAGRDLAGLDRFAARKAAVEALGALGLLEKEEPYKNNVGYSQRADVPIEPRLSEQWFLKYPSLEAAREVVASGKMKFHPDRWAKVYDHWLEKIQDWCISRQLWWGHQIPVWYRQQNGKQEIHCDVEPPTGAGWTQDPDVLDTWFSSWLWAYETMDAATRRKFYPTSVLVTGPDIIFFWVARMIFAGFEYMGALPFHDVYYTGIIRDKQGRKMSKSLGNSPDPLDLIAKFGADALRFGVMRSAPLGQDILFDEQNVELGRNFANKLWNACRFRQMQGGETEAEIDPRALASEDKWILLKLNVALRELDTAFTEYNFSAAAQTLYRFFWNEYCDWYVEASKAVFFGTDEARKGAKLAVIDFVLAHTLRMFHPFMPFITEELWHAMGYSAEMPSDQGGVTIMNAPWPKPFDADFLGHYGLDDCYLENVDAQFELVSQGRNLKRTSNVPAGRKVRFILNPRQSFSAQEVEIFKLLLNAEAFELKSEYAGGKGVVSVSTALGDLYLPLEGLVDIDAEKARLLKEQEKYVLEIRKVEEKLANPAFTGKVPASVLAEHQKRLADWQSKFEHVGKALKALDDL